MAKAKKLPTDKKIFGINIFPLILIFVAAASVFIYDRTIWFAQAQQNASNSPSAVLTCVNNTNGNVRVVTSLDTCKKEERGIALQSAVSNLLSDVEVVWYQPPGDRNTNFEDGVDVSCPDGKTVIGGGSTEVVRRNVPEGDSVVGGSGQTTDPVEKWSITPWRYETAPVVYAICAKVNP